MICNRQPALKALAYLPYGMPAEAGSDETGYRLLTTGYRPLSTDDSLLATDDWIPITGEWRLTTDDSLLATIPLTPGTAPSTIIDMNMEDLISELKKEPVQISRLLAICEIVFGRGRMMGGHQIFRTPWVADPRLSLQKDLKIALPYQVNRVIRCLRRIQLIGKKRESE